MKISELEKLNDMEKKNWWYKNRRTVITNFLSGLSFEKILDYGCGTGATTSSLKKFGAVLVLIDQNLQWKKQILME